MSIHYIDPNDGHEEISEMFVFSGTLTRLIARDFSAFIDRESFKSYIRDFFFLFGTTSRLALGPIQHPIQWVPGVFPCGVKRQEREADHSPPPGNEIKNDGATSPLLHTSSWRGS
jgi:hypothetical protein